MIYTARAFDADSIHYEGKWEEGWALEIETLLGPVKWHRADRRVPFGAQKSRADQPLTRLKNPERDISW